MIAVSATTNAENVISSPNKKITVEIKNDIEANHSGLRICYENKVIQTYVKIGIATGKNVFFDNLNIIPAGKPELIKDEYEMITGKRRLCSNYATVVY